jgi:hypothetical protein
MLSGEASAKRRKLTRSGATVDRLIQSLGFLAMSGAFLALFWYATKTGELLGKGISAYRDDSPLLFQIGRIAYAVVAIIMLLGALNVALGWM